MRYRKAYTLIEVSLSLMILNLVVLLWVYLFNALSHFEANIDQRENRIGLIQLRRMLALGKEINIEFDELCMNFRDEETCFYEVNHRLIQTPGTQIYLINVENVMFEEKDEVYILSYTLNDLEFESVIGFK